MKSMFVPPNNCLVCEARGVPIGSRSIFMFEHESICGHCGNHLWGNPSGELPGVVVSVLRSLLQHGLFHLKPDSKHQPLTLYRGFDLEGNDRSMVICDISYSHQMTNSENTAEFRPYRRSEIPCSMPAAVFDAAELIAKTKAGQSGEVHPSLTMVDVSRDRKIIRFELRIAAEPAPNWKYAYECTRFELSWTDPDDSLAIPTSEMAAAAEAGDACQLEELRLMADYAALIARCIECMPKSGGMVSLFRADTEELFHAAAIARAIKTLGLRRWPCFRRGPNQLEVLRLYEW